MATITDRSGTIVLGGQAQLLMEANPDRVSWSLQNRSTVPMYFDDLGRMADPSSLSSVYLHPGAYYESEPSGASGAAIWIYCQRSNAPFVARELSVLSIPWTPTPIGRTTRFGLVDAKIPSEIQPVFTRETWVAQRVAVRYEERGDPLVLRRTSVIGGEVGFVNPLLYAPDITVMTAFVDQDGQVFFGLRASSLAGRLRVGDQMTTSTGLTSSTWAVMAMPPHIQSDPYGGQLAAPDGMPFHGEPQIYLEDACSTQDGQMMVVPVEAVATAHSPAQFIGCTPSFVFQCDEPIFGAAMSLNQLIELGWTEAQDMGISIAGTRTDGTTIEQLKVDDVIVVNGVGRNIMTIATSDRRGTKFLYQVRLR